MSISYKVFRTFHGKREYSITFLDFFDAFLLWKVRNDYPGRFVLTNSI